MVRLADGDRSAFGEVYEAAWPPVRQLARRMCGDAADAEDVAQLALLKVFERSHEYDPGRGRALPWILGIAAWEVRTWRRKQGRRREDALPPDLMDGGEDPEQAVAAAELRAHLHALLPQMGVRDQETLLAAAGVLPRPVDVAPATFRKRLQRATRRLRDAWRSAHG